ncbi:hypothetical protein FSP39_007291 [Pinctada imbricata]|uniref:C2H2-type domain-containing protein n=1 Tax=Pinctada imbricata TaxID=66713 RepID=A0AA88YN67_PINIB|nr:hypothetical protein FSP39_007291 [Pinctada imbricata]
MFTMAEDGFLTSLLERASEGDEDALQTLSDIKRKLDSVKLSQTVKNTSLNITSSKKEEAIEKHKEATKIKKVSSPEKGTQNTKLECDKCGKSFSSRRLLLRHFRSHVSKKPICELCGSEFTRMDNLKRHRKRVHMDRVEEDLPAKKKCKKTSTVTSSSLQTPENSSNIDPIDVSSHTNSTNMEQSVTFSKINSSENIPSENRLPSHNGQEGGNNTDVPSDVEENNEDHDDGTLNKKHQYSDESSLNNSANVRSLYPNSYDENDLITFLGNIKNEIIEHLIHRRKVLKHMKWYVCVQVELEKVNVRGETVQSSPFFRSNNYILLQSYNVSEHNINEALQKMFAAFEEFMREGSNWNFKRVIKLDINTASYSPLGGSSYIPTPVGFHQGVLNIFDYNDQKCFLWSVLAYLHPVDDITPERVHHYTKFENELDITDIECPVTVADIPRSMCLNYYNLDCLHFYTSPGLAFNAALKMTNISLELITDPDMYLFFESAVRGGVSMISNKYSKANNPYVADTFDHTQPNKYIIYTDCNNLYGKAMTAPLPTGMFRWVSDVENFDVKQIPKNGDKGYVLEVDLEYPDKLHDLNSDYPLAPESMCVSDDELSPYSQGLWEKINPPPKTSQKGLVGRIKTKKLIPNLKKKSKYILHYRNLQLYLDLGLKLKKIHRIVEFHQAPWLKTYIDFNSQKRKEAKKEFEKDFFKLMNNSVFGKTMENVRNRVDIKLAHIEKKLKKFVSKPSFRRFQIFNQDLVGIENMKTKLVLDKPIYVGQAILDLSKCIMYDFHYNYVKKKYDQKAKLLFTDTDSLCYEIHTNDIYEDIFKDKQLFDLSNYPPNDKHFDSTNKKVPGVFKDETGKVPIKSFVGLRSKMYSFTYAEKEKQVAKGIARATIKNDLRHHMYEDCLFNETIQICQMKSIRSENHTMQVKHINKLGLTAFDDKRYVLNNGCDTLAFGHYMTEYLNIEVDF